jgi:protein-tyrosine phosphatase
MVRDVALVLTMTASHKRMAMDLYPFAADKIFTLQEYAFGTDADVLDPFGGSYAHYEQTAEQLEHAILAMIEKWTNEEEVGFGPHP